MVWTSRKPCWALIVVAVPLALWFALPTQPQIRATDKAAQPSAETTQEILPRLPAQELSDAYFTDSHAADGLYGGKVIEVEGNVLYAAEDIDLTRYIRLEIERTGAYYGVTCPTSDERWSRMRAGDYVILRGQVAFIRAGRVGNVRLLKCTIVDWTSVTDPVS